MLPRLLITLGDVAGIGPEIIVKAWPGLLDICRPVVVGDVGQLRRTLAVLGQNLEVLRVRDLDQAAADLKSLPCLQATEVDLRDVRPGAVSRAAGRAAYDFLCRAIDDTLANKADGIVTCPLHKEGLRRAGIPQPGHTEILAERTGTPDFAMMLYLPPPIVPGGLGVVHTTLHLALRDIFPLIRPDTVLAKIRLLNGIMGRLTAKTPRLAVCALNPHAGDGGLFGDEEATILTPAIEQARAEGITVSGPYPSDNLFVRASRGEFDGIVALYHDQGHIPLKLLGGFRAVNISVGLPIVRTSVAHGTAYDIAGTNQADPRSLLEAARVAAKLCRPACV